MSEDVSARVLESLAEREFVLGAVRVSPLRNELSSSGETVSVEPKSMDLLVRLCKTLGQVCSRQDLLEDIWPDTTVGDESLTRAVSLLRKALKDLGGFDSYVRTVPKRGYMISDELEVAVLDSMEQAPANITVVGSTVSANTSVSLPSETAAPVRNALITAGVICLIVVVVVFQFWLNRPSESDKRMAIDQIIFEAEHILESSEFEKAWALAMPLKGALDTYPAHFEGWIMMSKLYQTGNAGRDKILEALENASRLRPDDPLPTAIRYRITFHEDITTLPTALEITRKAAAAYPDRTDVQFSLSFLLSLSGYAAESEEVARLLYERDPLYHNGATYRGQRLKSLGRYAEAIKHYMTVLDGSLEEGENYASTLEHLVNSALFLKDKATYDTMSGRLAEWRRLHPKPGDKRDADQDYMNDLTRQMDRAYITSETQELKRLGDMYFQRAQELGWKPELNGLTLTYGGLAGRVDFILGILEQTADDSPVWFLRALRYGYLFPEGLVSHPRFIALMERPEYVFTAENYARLKEVPWAEDFAAAWDAR